MPRTCTVCSHDEAHVINVALVQRDSYRKIPGYISDPDERRVHIQRMKEADVKELAERLRREASPVLERYPEEVERRREELQKTIFSGQDVSAETLARVATATDEQLERM